VLNKLDKFHKTRTGYAAFALIELALAYVFISWAIDSGNWLDYLLALVFTIGFLQNITRLIGALVRGKKRSAGRAR
jgi:hypothetical protein